jgi:hypothetical protein
MEFTERLSLPFILPGQAQKEVSHNEALQLLDALVAGAIQGIATNDPPAAPAPGTCYLIGQAPSGEWAGHAGCIAVYADAGLRFIQPTEGMYFWVKSTQTFAVYGEGGWEIGAVHAARVLVNGVQVVGERADAIADPSGGTAVDVEARSTLVQILAVLRQHGLISP